MARPACRGVAVADPRAGIIAALIALIFGGGAMARDLGDFGRVENNAFNRVIAPVTEDGRVPLGGGAVLDTDEERLMLDLIFRFRVPPQAEHHAVPEAPATSRAGQVAERAAYFRWLKSVEVASAPTRYRMMSAHLNADLALLPRAFAAICAVEAMDHRRAFATQKVASLDEMTLERVDRRLAVNRQTIAEFAALLEARAEAYQFALDHLLAETPYPESRAVDIAIGSLSLYAGRANAGQFCEGETRAGEPAPAPRKLLSLPPLK